MIGNHSIPMIVDAFLKGFDGFDAEKAFRQIKNRLPKVNIRNRIGTYTIGMVTTLMTQ